MVLIAPASPYRSLLVDAIDYAGLFPPAALGMAAAVESFRGYRVGSEAWALGRFVVPGARLQELAGALQSAPATSSSPWLLSVTCGDDPRQDAERMAEFEAGPAGGLARIDTVEFRSATVEALLDGLAALPAQLARYAEIPLAEDLVPFVAALKFRGAAAKFRTGGVTAGAFPQAEFLLRGLEVVVGAAVPFKCTAGLHHPVRGQYRLTYEPGSDAAAMYGYLNVMLCAAALVQGETRETALQILLEEDPGAFAPADGDLCWRDLRFPRELLRAVRRRGMRSFGSCSFREPLDELEPLVLP